MTVVMNGDLLWHNTLWFSAKEDARRRGRGGYDFAPLLSGMKPVVASADLAICHEEVPLAAAGGPYRNYPLFSAPPQVVKAIKATGYDVCTTASNHAVDQGFAGVRRTLDDLDQAKIAHAGTARSNAESQQSTIFTTRQGMRIGIVAATFSLNGLPMPKGKPWAVHRLSTKDLLGQARRARTAGADIVLAAVHIGTEYWTAENAQQVALARALTASPDVDLVYMHHPHVVQPWTIVNKKWVLYGVGNTVAQQEANRTYEGATGFLLSHRVSDAVEHPLLVHDGPRLHDMRVMHIDKINIWRGGECASEGDLLRILRGRVFGSDVDGSEHDVCSSCPRPTCLTEQILGAEPVHGPGLTLRHGQSIQTECRSDDPDPDALPRREDR